MNCSDVSLYRVPDGGGDSTPVAKLDASLEETEHVGPDFLPDGLRFLYLAVSSQPDNSAICVGSLDSPERTRLFKSNSKAVYAAPGYVLFNRGDAVYAQAFDADKLVIKGEPGRVADGVPLLAVIANVTPLAVGLQKTAAFAVSQTGIFSFRLNGVVPRGNQPAGSGDSTPKSLTWLGRGRTGTTVGGAQGTYAGVNLAPDGKRFAVHRHEGGGGDIWLYDPAQGDRMQRWTTDVSQENSITNDGGAWPRWRGDGKTMELYFVNAGIKSVILRAVGESIQSGVPPVQVGIGNPELLNSTHYSTGGSYHRYAVAPNGESFLLAQTPPAPAPARGAGPPPGGRRSLSDQVLAGADTFGGQTMNQPNEIAIILRWPRLMKP